jgi:predicted phosphodiesterase
MKGNCILFFVLVSFLLVFGAHAQSSQNWKKTDVEYSLILLGDVGDDATKSSPVLKAVKQQIAGGISANGVVFLGDNLYPNGLHKKESKYRKADEARLNPQLDAVNKENLDVVFIPGNHDWDRQGNGGYKKIKRQEKYIQNYLDKGNTFRPSHGCPGPDVVKLSKGLVLVAIDTQWWLHKHERGSGEADKCDVRNTAEFMVLFKDVLKKYRNQNIIVAGHHPLYSNGEHGGYFSAKDHLFPFLSANSKAYLPLPILGSVYPLYRKFVGHNQDIAHPVYQQMKNELLAAMNEYDNVIYVAGHEHNLQYTKQTNIHHIISGSGSKTTHLKKDKKLLFGSEKKGFSKISYLKNGEIWLQFYSENSSGEVDQIYEQILFSGKIKMQADTTIAKVSYAGQTKRVIPDSTYAASKIKELFFGKLNRQTWAQPITVPVLDIHFEKGGLIPIKRGGGQQTVSLRMQGGDGKEYVLRGIKKNATFLTGRNLRGTIAQDILYDGMAGSHPYASVVIPPLADAVGIMHTNPKLVYVPKDSVLGDYLNEFGGMLCLFEERPNGDMSDIDGFGGSKRVMGHSDILAKIHTKHHHQIDQEYMLRARLFDMLLGDWDRHDDQWRWAKFTDGNKTIYRAVPRDRDQAFFKFDGLIPNIANRKWMVRKFQNYGGDIRDIYGQNFNARYFDRTFLTQANRYEWIEAAEKIKRNLSDGAIDSALALLPKEAFAIAGQSIADAMKIRRNRLPELAQRYYKVLSKSVDVVGTLKRDYFEVIRKESGDVEVNIYAIKKGAKDTSKRSFHRVFQLKDTKEIVLYGLDSKDEYVETNEGFPASQSIVVRIVAGDKKDAFRSEAKINNFFPKTYVYDAEGKRDLVGEGKLKLIEKSVTSAYDYDRKSFTKNKLMPLASVGYNPDDGIILGPGFKYTAHGFKKTPYKYYHKLLVNKTFAAEGYNVYYDMNYTKLLGPFDVGAELTVNSPLFYNFFGIGNKVSLSKKDEVAAQKIRMNLFEFKPKLSFVSHNTAQQFELQFVYQDIAFENNVERQSFVQASELQDEHIGGLRVVHQYKNLDNEVNPHRGIVWKNEMGWKSSTASQNIEFFTISSELSLFIPIRISKNQSTLAFRSGWINNSGRFAFYQANFLSGYENFRGIRRNRFGDKAVVYNNVDLRHNLLKVPNYIVPFNVGVLAHYDVAKVYNHSSENPFWHQAYGAGLFVNVLDFVNLVGTYSVSNTDRLFSVSSRFLF